MTSSPLSFQNLKADILRATVLAIFVALVWCTLMGRWSLAAWRTPLEYTEHPERTVDVFFYFAEAKAAMEGVYAPLFEKVFPQLGAPYSATWGDYPTTEQFIMWLTGILARGVGLFAACNLMVMFTQVLAAISMFAVCRAIGCHWAWSFAIGIAFGLAPYAFSRAEHHLDLTFCWHIPLCLLVTRWLSTGDGLRLTEKKFFAALVIAFVTGLLNQYYTYMFLQLALLGGVAQCLRRGWRSILPALAVCASSSVAFLLLILDSLIFRVRNGPNPEAFVRAYSLIELYALKLVSLFVPFSGHRFFPGVADHYASIVAYRGELPNTSYLGLIGIAAFVCLCAHSFFQQVKRRRAMELEAAQTLWIILQASVGGLNALFALIGFYMFRATGRYSIFILALVLIFAARKLSHWTANQPRLAILGAAAVTVLVLLDQTPPVITNQQVAEIAEVVNSDKEFTAKMESRLPAQAMVYQLPYVEFPEAFPALSYNHFRPYLFSDHLRFSFGDVRGRHRGEWMSTLASLPVEQAIHLLKEKGFSAIYVDREQYRDRASSSFEAFSKLGLPVLESPRRDLFCVLLTD